MGDVQQELEYSIGLILEKAYENPGELRSDMDYSRSLVQAVPELFSICWDVLHECHTREHLLARVREGLSECHPNWLPDSLVERCQEVVSKVHG